MRYDSTLLMDVLTFWFGPDLTDPPFREVWFKTDPAFDAAIKNRFSDAYIQAARGDFDDADTPHHMLAVVLILDQFPRNLFRGTAKAFATDDKALSIADSAIQQGFDDGLPTLMRVFLYMPFEHSEDQAVQERSLTLFARLNDDDIYRYAKDHYDVVARFGRFPHRNTLLGRTSTPEENTFLAEEAGAFDWTQNA